MFASKLNFIFSKCQFYLTRIKQKIDQKIRSECFKEIAFLGIFKNFQFLGKFLNSMIFKNYGF